MKNVVSGKRIMSFAVITAALAFAAPFAEAESCSFPVGLGVGAWCDIFPVAGFAPGGHNADSYIPSADDLTRYLESPAFSSLGLSLARGPIGLAIVFELQQDFGQWLMGYGETNMPISGRSSGFCFGTLYPQVGFIEGQEEGWHFSAGRRRLVLGSAVDFSLGVSGLNPWYDHVLAGLSARLGEGSIGCDALVLDVRRLPEKDTGGDSCAEKILMINRIAYAFPDFSFSISEFNLLAGVNPDMEDVNPFLVAHHLFADGSNIMLLLDANWRPSSDCRLYGEYLLDDFQLASEKEESNPNAMGFLVGMEWRLKSGQSSQRPAYYRRDYGIRLGPSPLKGGLIMRIEGALASTYLYRRNKAYADQVISTRYTITTASDFGSVTVNSFFANPLGPDRAMASLAMSFEDHGFFWGASLSATALGSESDETVYDFPYRSSWVGPQDPIAMQYGVKISVSNQFDESEGGYFSVEQLIPEAGDMKTYASVGFVHRFSIGQSSVLRGEQVSDL